MKFIKTLKNSVHIKNKILIVFDDTIADIRSNKKLNPVVTELFIKRYKAKHFLFLSHTLILLYRKMLG